MDSIRKSTAFTTFASNDNVNMGARAQSDLQIAYRTMSIRVDTIDYRVNDPNAKGHAKKGKKDKKDPAGEIKEITYHLNNPNDVFTRFSSHPTLGLDKEVVARKTSDPNRSLNQLTTAKANVWKKTAFYVFGGFNALMWIAFIVTVLSYQPLGSLNGGTPAVFNLGVAVLIMLVIVSSATFYALVDWRAGKIMASINSIVASEATVIRDGQEITIPANQVLLGDLVTLRMGQRVPCDLRLTEVSADLAFDRMMMTGESDPIPGAVEPTDNNPLETNNLAFSSTFVVQGTGRGVCIAIGDSTVMGHIVQLSGNQKAKPSIIQKEISKFTWIVSGLAGFSFIVAIIIWVAWIRTAYPDYSTASGAIINAIGCLTAFVPQGLPICIALTLTIVAKSMARQNILVKNLSVVETLGCITVLCSDKTGTLTMGHMHVEQCAFLDKTFTSVETQEASTFDAPENKGLFTMHQIARLCNGAYFEHSDMDDAKLPVSERSVKGDATDSSILRFGESMPNTPSLLQRFTKLYTVAFNSKVKYMITVVQQRKTDIETDIAPYLFVKGAPDILVKQCVSFMQADGTERPLDQAALEKMQMIQDIWASQGQRVLIMCRRRLQGVMPVLNSSNNNGKATVDTAQIDWNAGKASEATVQSLVTKLTLVGFIGIRDPPREQVAPAIDTIHQAHVRVFMVTGDFRNTAVAIAKQVRIVRSEQVDSLQDVRSEKFESHRMRFSNGPASAIKPHRISSSSLSAMISASSKLDLDMSDTRNTKMPADAHVKAPSGHEVMHFGSGPGKHNSSHDDHEGALLHSGVDMNDYRALAITGAELADMTVDDWNVAIGCYHAIVFARTTPEQKLLIVEEIKKRGDNTVAVTGDGVNDAPALKAADIGVAMGAGSDVAKDTAAMVLLTNNFAAIPVAIENGRLVFDNLKKVILFLMPTGTYVEFIAVLANVFLGMQIPLSSFLQIWFCVVNDVMLAIALMFEQPESDLMHRNPRNPRKERLTDWRFFFQIYFVIGLIAWPCAMAMYFYYMSDNNIYFHDILLSYSNWNTVPLYRKDGTQYSSDDLTALVNSGQCVYYITMVFMQFGSMMALRNRRVTTLESNPFYGPRQNLKLFMAMTASALVAVFCVYFPPFNSLFGTAPIPAKFWFIPMAIGLGILIVDDARKALVRAYPNSLLARCAW